MKIILLETSENRFYVRTQDVEFVNALLKQRGKISALETDRLSAWDISKMLEAVEAGTFQPSLFLLLKVQAENAHLTKEVKLSDGLYQDFAKMNWGDIYHALQYHYTEGIPAVVLTFVYLAFLSGSALFINQVLRNPDAMFGHLVVNKEDE